VILIAVAVVTPSRPLLNAQTAPQIDFLHIAYMQLKPESVLQWNALQRQEVIPAQKKGGLLWRETWNAGAVGGDTYERILLTPVTDLSQFDDPGSLDKALGTQGAQALLEKNRRLITGNRAYIARIRRDLGFGSRPPSPHIGVISTITVVAGRREDFEQGLKGPVVTAMKDANAAQFFVWQIVYGGDTNQYLTVLMFENFEQLALGHPDPLAWAMRGDEITRILGGPNSPIAKIERTIVQYMPELSYRP
jgi:hypothetical protein